jgi:hypothetical protein
LLTSPKKSVRRLSGEWNISRSIVQRLVKDRGAHPVVLNTNITKYQTKRWSYTQNTIWLGLLLCGTLCTVLVQTDHFVNFGWYFAAWVDNVAEFIKVTLYKTWHKIFVYDIKMMSVMLLKLLNLMYKVLSWVPDELF